MDDNFQRLHTSEDEVRRTLKQVNPNNASGPDNIALGVLKTSAAQLAHIFCIIFNVCFSTNTVPAAWKTICIVPVPKRPVILSLDDLCHVALTAAVMKVCVRVVLCKLDSLVKNYSDPLQFANRRNRSTVDAVLYVLENINLHLEKNREFCMTDVLPVPVPLIQSHSHVQKLSDMKLPSSVISWIFDYPTKRLQYVWLSGALSSVICTNTGAPQGTVLAPFLFSLYTADCNHCVCVSGFCPDDIS